MQKFGDIGHILQSLAKSGTFIMQVGTKGNKAGVEEDAYRLPTGIFNF